ncbi:iron-containing redox enzyme family protein [Xanthomonas cerealis pv. cerealis]|uniref:Iron-containing redox enzyme family protein n=1 Tax=Xanthomonas cerealis pv. cerealis TaxID=152263 RepID=A0A514EBX5_9XANT|nr:iron-containing redox enzyme family protein [Xanthomonas translucens]QDI03455.1 iron-containing redox enzyme family protein [Xanthomonas translucens pv. cerealis]
MSTDFIARLEAAVAQEWDYIRTGRFWDQVLAQPVTTDLYRLLMEQIYHYTRHNSVNQATAAYKTDPQKRKLLRFVYKHALEELGHEAMVVHDLTVKGLHDPARLQQRPLPATQALIAYLYQVALERGAIARLGYSYWAESCYGHIDEILKKISKDLNLTPKDMSFFVAHSDIDAKHSEEVIEAIGENALSLSEQEDIIDVATTTLYLTGQILEQVEREYRQSLTTSRSAA